jgi:hypothetical protein
VQQRQFCSETPASLRAGATDLPWPASTSTCRSFAITCSALGRFAILSSSSRLILSVSPVEKN